MVPPAVPADTLAVLVTPTSAKALMPMKSVAVLFAGLLSAVVIVTVLVALTCPLPGTVNVTVLNTV